MARYRYFTTDVITNEVLAELPLNSVVFDRAINTSGMFEGNIPLGDPSLKTVDVIRATEKGRTAIWVDRDGAIVWGGIIWTRTYDSKNKILQIQGNDHLSYFDHRFIKMDLNYSGWDQLTAVQDLLRTIMGVAGSWNGLTIEGVETSYTLPDPFQYVGEQEKNVLAEVQRLAQQASEDPSLPHAAGFEFTTLYKYDTDHISPKVRFHIGYPNLGRTVTGWLFEAGIAADDNILDYTWPEDATIQANSVIGTGSGSPAQKIGDQSTQLIAINTDPELITKGVPLLETVANFSTITDSTQLSQLVLGHRLVHQDAVTVPVINVYGSKDPVFGSYALGDVARIRIRDERFPNGLDTDFRIVGMQVKPEDKEVRDIETVALTLAPLLPNSVTLADIINPSAPTPGPGPTTI